MELKDIKAVIDLMKRNDLSVFEMEKDGFKLKLQKGFNAPPPAAATSAPAPAQAGTSPAGAAGSAAAPMESAPAPSSSFRDIVSPMVGTFYRAASPESPAYADIGTSVNEESVVCIIEAMKVMNEIKAETTGTIAEIVAENGKPVQFGQVLFRVK